MTTEGHFDTATTVMDSDFPVPLTSHALIERHYESTYRILEKNLEDQYMIRKKNLNDVVAGLEELISSQSEELSAYKRQIWDKDDYIRDLRYEISELKQRMLKVSEMSKAAGKEENERETSFGGNINTLTKPEVSQSQGTKSDSRFGQEKELPRRSKAEASEMASEIDGFGSRLSTAVDVEQRGTSPSSAGTSSRGRRPKTMSPRLEFINEHEDVSNGRQSYLPLHELNSPMMLHKSLRPSSLGVSLGGSEHIHPLHRPQSLPRASTFDYPSGQDRVPPVSSTATPAFPTFTKKLGARQHDPEPQLTPETPEPDFVIRAKIRTEAEKRKAASFGPGDKIKKTDIVHSVVLSHTRLPESQPVPKTRVEILTEAGFEKPELQLKRIVSDDSKRTGGGLRQVVRRLKSDMWRRGSSSKRSESPVYVVDE